MSQPEELAPRFKIRAPLRCDGVGSLDCAEDAESGARMAVRWLPLDANGEAAARAVEGLPPHPTLPRIRGTGRVGSAAFVAMDFPDGRLLSTSLGEPMAKEALCRTVAEIAGALEALHAQGVVHGELSADSILLVPASKAILWDVPLILANRLTDRRGEERQMAQLLRIAPFLSPERARGMPASSASDVYALGTVFSLAAGGAEPPGATTLAVIHHIGTGQWRPEVPARYPEAVQALLSRMVHPDPLRRPSAREVASLLLEAPKAAARERGEPDAEADLVPPRRVLGLTGWLTLALALVGLGAFGWALFGEGAGRPATLQGQAPKRAFGTLALSRDPLPPPEAMPPPEVDSQAGTAEAPSPERVRAGPDAPAEVLEPLVAPVPPAPTSRVAAPARKSGVKRRSSPRAPENPPEPPRALGAERDFGFLPTEVPPPASDLKRPSF